MYSKPKVEDKTAMERYSLNEVKRLFDQPLLELVYQAATVHREYHNSRVVQVCSLLSIKTGACPEDCAYCPQSAHHPTNTEKHSLLSKSEVIAAAESARRGGASRFCMGAAWREVKDGPDFDEVLEMVEGVADLGLEVCCTLGMISESQAIQLKEKGLTAYNHNLDSSEEFYPSIISTRNYQQRLDTLGNVRSAGISVCCGGIIGMGETADDRISLLYTLANLP